MQPALQIQSAPSRTTVRKNGNLWNKPDVEVRLTGSHLVEMFHALSSTLLPAGDVFPLTRVDDIPAAVEYHTNLSVPARTVGDVDTYFRHAQLAALLKKVEFPIFEDACMAKAMEKWHESEAACKTMNEMCADILAHPHSTKHVALRDQLSEMRQELEILLGKEPPSKESLADYCGFGPGADASHRRTEGNAAYKLFNHSVLETQDLEGLESVFPSVLATGGNTAQALVMGYASGIVSIESARLEFVPKTCQEHRTIEIMPSLATFEAKGLDAHIRLKLKQVWNIDLATQEPNRHLAFLGSLEDSANSPVTLDLSSASDRISMGLVRLILPIEWSRRLFPLRSRDVILPDETVLPLHKFASMGNSLTFSLQTAIYGAIIVRAYRAAGLRWKKWRAYGDDLIVVKSVAHRVITALELVGFKLNAEKSFVEGPFRESCGRDYLQGQNVRPFYIKKPIRTVGDLFKYINRLQTVAVRSPIPASSFRGLFSYLLKLVPEPLRFTGSPAYGLEALVWSPLSAVPSRILRERVVETKIPTWVSYKISLLNGCSDSLLKQNEVKGDAHLTLEKEPVFFTPSSLLKWKQRVSLEKGAREITSTLVRESEAIPSGVVTLIVRRPGKPGHSPLSNDEIKLLMLPIW
jgi:hypothetical protein